MQKYKVLVADDNPMLANMVSAILNDLQIANAVVNSGADVLTALKQDYFDLLLIDIMMPKLSGLEVSKIIREVNTHTPIVALTSLPYEEVCQELSACGINHYLEKPPKLEDLKNMLLDYFKTAA